MLCVAVCAAAAVVGSAFTRPNLDWYRTLHKPPLTPPDWVFGPVWTALYLTMAVAAFLVWRRVIPPAKVRAALGAFALQLLFNVAWSIVFFGAHSPVGGLVVVLMLWFSIAVTALLFARVSRVAAALLLPYLAWVAFAAYLNGGIVPLNY